MTEEQIKTFHAVTRFLILRDFLFDIDCDNPQHMEMILSDECALLSYFGREVVLGTILIDGIVYPLNNTQD